MIIALAHLIAVEAVRQVAGFEHDPSVCREGRRDPTEGEAFSKPLNQFGPVLIFDGINRNFFKRFEAAVYINFNPAPAARDCGGESLGQNIGLGRFLNAL